MAQDTSFLQFCLRHQFIKKSKCRDVFSCTISNGSNYEERNASCLCPNSSEAACISEFWVNGRHGSGIEKNRILPCAFVDPCLSASFCFTLIATIHRKHCTNAGDRWRRRIFIEIAIVNKAAITSWISFTVTTQQKNKWSPQLYDKCNLSTQQMQK